MRLSNLTVLPTDRRPPGNCLPLNLFVCWAALNTRMPNIYVNDALHTLIQDRQKRLQRLSGDEYVSASVAIADMLAEEYANRVDMEIDVEA